MVTEAFTNKKGIRVIIEFRAGYIKLRAEFQLNQIIDSGEFK